MTPTPISSDIPNKVCVAPALAETDAENTAELSQARAQGGREEGKRREKEVCAGVGERVRGVLGEGVTGGRRITVQKICDL